VAIGADDPSPAILAARLSEIDGQLREIALRWHPWDAGGDNDRDASARNLLQYVALRGHDLRGLQDPLAELGLSSLGRSEGHVQASVSAVLNALTALALRPPVQSSPAPVGFAASRQLLATRTAALLGPMRPGRPTRIMVTMPRQAGRDPGLVAQMLAAGMDCARINCAHDAASDWRGMLDNVRRAEARTQRRVRVLVDLPGPKL
jgi:pyruvate kinase